MNERTEHEIMDWNEFNAVYLDLTQAALQAMHACDYDRANTLLLALEEHCRLLMPAKATEC